jgi:hypothetical protein
MPFVLHGKIAGTIMRAEPLEFRFVLPFTQLRHRAVPVLVACTIFNAFRQLLIGEVARA